MFNVAPFEHVTISPKVNDGTEAAIESGSTSGMEYRDDITQTTKSTGPSENVRNAYSNKWSSSTPKSDGVSYKDTGLLTHR